MTTPHNYTIRPARAGDEVVIVELVRELAIYEKLEHAVQATPERLSQHLFGERPFAEAILAEDRGEPVGFALYFHSFSTFKALPGLYLEDLFVRPPHRGHGVGKALLARVARVAVERGCGRLEWSVLNWNEPAIQFYLKMGSRPMDEWTVHRVDGEALVALAHLDRDSQPTP